MIGLFFFLYEFRTALMLWMRDCAVDDILDFRIDVVPGPNGPRFVFEYRYLGKFKPDYQSQAEDYHHQYVRVAQPNMKAVVIVV